MIDLIIASGIIIVCLWLLNNWYRRERISVRKERMRLYSFTRNDKIGSGECIGAVIAAKNCIRAREIMDDLAEEYEVWGWKCTMISSFVDFSIKEGIVLDSWSN